MGLAGLRGRLRGSSWGRALRDSAFSVVSITTTTGFVTADFDKWDTAAKLTLVLLMFVGGCAGSTAGGIKVIRIIVCLPHHLAGHLQDGASQGRYAPWSLEDGWCPKG